jgi:hypothetical protein
MSQEKTYINLLEQAREELKGKAISYEDFIKRVNDLQIGQHPALLWRSIYGGDGHQMTERRHMGIDAYFQLLEYEELKHALESSKEAKRHANTALWVSVALGTISILVAIIQIVLSLR